MCGPLTRPHDEGSVNRAIAPEAQALPAVLRLALGEVLRLVAAHRSEWLDGPPGLSVPGFPASDRPGVPPGEAVDGEASARASRLRIRLDRVAGRGLAAGAPHHGLCGVSCPVGRQRPGEGGRVGAPPPGAPRARRQGPRGPRRVATHPLPHFRRALPCWRLRSPCTRTRTTTASSPSKSTWAWTSRPRAFDRQRHSEVSPDSASKPDGTPSSHQEFGELSAGGLYIEPAPHPHGGEGLEVGLGRALGGRRRCPRRRGSGTAGRRRASSVPLSQLEGVRSPRKFQNPAPGLARDSRSFAAEWGGPANRRTGPGLLQWGRPEACSRLTTGPDGATLRILQTHFE